MNLQSYLQEMVDDLHGSAQLLFGLQHRAVDCHVEGEALRVVGEVLERQSSELEALLKREGA